MIERLNLQGAWARMTPVQAELERIAIRIAILIPIPLPMLIPITITIMHGLLMAGKDSAEGIASFARDLG